ncbi:MAG TPA: adenylate kinase, partial [Thermodesulfobacteriota bacterium]
SDDQDGAAIDKRHAIYYDTKDGTLAAVNYFKDKAKKGKAGVKAIELDGRPGVKEVSEDLLEKLLIK